MAAANGGRCEVAKKQVMTHPLLNTYQLARLAKFDYDECVLSLRLNHTELSAATTKTGWRGDHMPKQEENDELSCRIAWEHQLYKGTGSVHAQARIDSYIAACIIVQQQQLLLQADKQKKKKSPRFSLLLFDDSLVLKIENVVQYHTLPDLGDAIRKSLLTVHHHHQRGGKGDDVDTTNSFLHMLLDSSIWVTPALVTAQTGGRGVGILGNCGKYHAKVWRHPSCSNANTPKSAHTAKSAHIKTATASCSLAEFSIICTLLLALLMGLYPRGRKCAVFPVRVQLWRRCDASV